MIAADGLPDDFPHQVRSTEMLRSERGALSEGGRVAAEGSAVYLYALAPELAPEMAPEIASEIAPEIAPELAPEIGGLLVRDGVPLSA